MHYMHETPNKHVPAKTNQGWNVAIFVWLLAFGCIGTVAYIYNATYKHPTDVRWHTPGAKAEAAH